MASSSSLPQQLTEKTKAKLRALPALHRAFLSYEYVLELRAEIHKCLLGHRDALLPQEIAEDILKRRPTNFHTWCSIIRGLWDGVSAGTAQYGQTATIHRGHDAFHTTVFINNQDFFEICHWDFSTLFENGFIDGFVLGRDPERPHCWGINDENLDGLIPELAQELRRWVRRHSSLTVWVETITPEWSPDYEYIYPSIHLVQIIPHNSLRDWKIIHWPSRPKIRQQPTTEIYWPEDITYEESTVLRAVSADSVRRSIETNAPDELDESWRLFNTITQTKRCIIQGYNKLRFIDSLESKIIMGEIPMSDEAKTIWEDYDDSEED